MRYYFDIRSAGKFTRDYEGTEFSGSDEVLAEAVRCALELIAYSAIRGDNAISWRFVITNAGGGDLIFPFKFASAPRRSLKRPAQSNSRKLTSDISRLAAKLDRVP